MPITAINFHSRPYVLAIGTLLAAVVSIVVACDGDPPAENVPDRLLDDASLETLSNIRSTGVGTFDEQFYTGALPRDAIVPVYQPEFVSHNEIELWPNELVMGVEINGEAHAYPIGLMRRREMVNDKVGGVPILVSW